MDRSGAGKDRPVNRVVLASLNLSYMVLVFSPFAPSTRSGFGEVSLKLG